MATFRLSISYSQTIDHCRLAKYIRFFCNPCKILLLLNEVMCTSPVASGTRCRFFMALTSSWPQAWNLSIKKWFYGLNVVWSQVSDGVNCLESCDKLFFLHEESVILIRFGEWIHSSLLQHSSLIRMWVECNFLKPLLVVNLIHPHSDSGFARICKFVLVADWIRGSLFLFVFSFFSPKESLILRLMIPSPCECYTARWPQTFVNLHLYCDLFDTYTQLE